MSVGPQPWLPAVIARLSEVSAVVRVVVAEVRGSTPREPGAYMLVDSAGVTGTIGGGRLEWEAIAAAQEMLRRGTRAAQLVDRVLGIDLGQCCGGVVAAWLECFPQESRAELCALNDRLITGSVVLTTAASTDTVRQMLSSGVAAEDNAMTLLSLPRQQASPRVLRTREGEIWFLERLDDEYPTVWLYGAGHVGKALAGILLQLPLRLLWLDPRSGQFPEGAAAYSRVLPEADLVRTVRQAAPGTYFIVMTHDHGLDYDLCRAALLRDDATWLGLIGSQSKSARFRARLRREGFAAAVIDRLVCPIGVTGITSKWPAAIAVAIGAQLMQILSATVQPTVAVRIDSGGSCAAGECGTCGKHVPDTRTAQATET